MPAMGISYSFFLPRLRSTYVAGLFSYPSRCVGASSSLSCFPLSCLTNCFAHSVGLEENPTRRVLLVEKKL